MTDRPRPAPAHFPYAHRTLAEVDRDEAYLEQAMDLLAYGLSITRDGKRVDPFDVFLAPLKREDWR